MKVLRIMFVALVCVLMFANCGGKGGEKDAAKEETFSMEGLNACEKVEKLDSLITYAEKIAEGVYQADEFCFRPIKNASLIGSFDDIDNCTIEGNLTSGVIKMYRNGLRGSKDVKFKFENGIFSVAEPKTFREQGTYQQEEDIITISSKNGKVMATFNYKKGVLWQKDIDKNGNGLIATYKKINETQE